MNLLTHRVLTACFVILLVSGAKAQEPIRFGRTPDISPDGKTVAFSYLGDIWVVESIGGIARPVTMHQAHDIYPVFSPDGQWIAFSSTRHGNYDVFVVSARGGRPRRLTYHSSSDIVCGWSPDGQSILFASTRRPAFPSNYELYLVPVAGGRVRRLGVDEGKEGQFSPKGDQVVYVRGPGTWYRKGYRGSSNTNIWIFDLKTKTNRQLTTFDGRDISPMWSPDGKYIYYVSSRFGQANVVRQAVDGKSKPTQLTFHTDDHVRQARLSRNGQWIVYECGTDLWVVSTSGDDPPRKLAIEVYADDKTNPDRDVTYTSGVTEFALARDEKHIVFVVHGELFLIPISGGTARRLTNHPAYDHNVAWSPDSQRIIFASDRGGHEDLYMLEPDDKEHPKLVEAHQFKIKQITHTPEAEYGVSYSPDGKKVCFIRSGKLWTMNPDGTDQKVLVADVKVIDYDWSPDAKWIAFSRMDGSFSSEMYLIPSDGSAPARNATRYATWNAGITWSANGKKIAFLSRRPRDLTMQVMSLEKPLAPGAKETTGVNIDWDGLHLRVTEPARYVASEGAISRDASLVAFRSTAGGGDDLWIASTNGGSVRRVTNTRSRPRQIMWSRRLSDLVYFRDGNGSLRMIRVNSPGTPALIPFRAKMKIRREEEFMEMFEQSWRALHDNFYDEQWHGVDWHAVRKRYRPVVKHVAMKEDLYALISLMFGELNASHLGIRGNLYSAEASTAELGLIFDESFPGPRLRVAEILKNGPADKRGIKLKAGDIIGAIDRVPLAKDTSLAELLNGKINQTVELKVTSDPKAKLDDTKAWRNVEIRATSQSVIRDLMYERWVERNARRVAELSKGKLGYIHIPSMDQEGLDRFVRALYDNFDKDAIIIDVRFNSGGYTHDQVLNYLGGKEHTRFRQRDGGAGWVLRSYDRKWTKPAAVLINNRSYSDAEIFPSAFRTLGLGKLVGEPTGGFVIGTSSITLIDGSSFRIPRTGVYTVKGVNMEKQGVVPDIVVIPHPDQLAKGMDPQLDKSVEVLLRDVVAWKKARSKIANASDKGGLQTTVPRKE
ncbi:MAG: tricorn protease [Gemmatales bacterium]|nr:MAG: tricorn protease [Gemmatales bacterium]